MSVLSIGHILFIPQPAKGFNYWRYLLTILDILDKELTRLVLYGGKDLTHELNRKIIELTLRYIHNTCQFELYDLS